MFDDNDGDLPQHKKYQDDGSDDSEQDYRGDDEDIDGNAVAVGDVDFDAGDISVADLIDKIRRGPYSKAFRPYHYSYSTPFAGRSRKLASGKKGIPKRQEKDNPYNFDDDDDDENSSLDEYDEESDEEDDRPRFDYRAHFDSFFTDGEDENGSDEDEDAFEES